MLRDPDRIAVIGPSARRVGLPLGEACQTAAEPDLLALTDLKWLMSAYVARIDVARLLREPDYARRCLDAACSTPSDLVRQLATRVLSPLI